MTPALAQPSVLVCEVTCALAPPSPGRFWESKWNWSAVPQMSPPAPCTVQTPFATSCVPARAGLPMSWQVQPAGAAPGGGGALVAVATPATTDVFTCPLGVGAARPAGIPPPGVGRGVGEPAAGGPGAPPAAG